MKVQLKIGEIELQFTYNYNEYFRNELKKYELTSLSDEYHSLSVNIVNDITDILFESPFFYKNRVRCKEKGITYITSYNDKKSIDYQISYNKDYKSINILLNRNLESKLPEYEYVLSGMMFFDIALHENYLPIHASAIKANDFAVLLSGPSHTGKSTQTSYFLDVFPEGIIINEDKPLVFIKDNELYICGSPWSGKNVINENITTPFKYLLFLNKAENTCQVCG